MKKVLVIGATEVDVAALVPQMPKGNEEFHPTKTTTRVGGDGFLCARVFHQMNMPFELLTVKGSGTNGDMAGSGLVELGVIAKTTEEIHGSSYTLIDENGDCAKMVLPSGEYMFEPKWIEELNPDDYSYVFLSSELAYNDSFNELVEKLRPFKGRIVVELGDKGCTLDLYQQELLFDLKPILHMTPLHSLQLLHTNENELLDKVKELHENTDNAVILYTYDGNSIYIDEEHEVSTNLVELHPVDRSYSSVIHASSFLCALSSGVTQGTALTFADNYTKTFVEEEGLKLNETDVKQLQHSLAESIVGGKINPLS